MKKILVRYYLVLFGGFFLFMGLVLISYHYKEPVQNFVDRYPYIFFPALFGYGYIYLKSLKAIVSTKEFQELEEESRKRAKENREKNLKKVKIIIPILAVYSVFHLICTVYLVNKIRSGGEVHFILENWAEAVVLPFVLLWLAIFWYKNTKKILKEEKENN